MGLKIKNRKITLLIVPSYNRRTWKFTISVFFFYGMVLGVLFLAVWASLIIVEGMHSFSLKRANQFLVNELGAIQKNLLFFDTNSKRIRLLLGIGEEKGGYGEKGETETKEDDFLSSPAKVRMEFQDIHRQTQEYEKSFREIEEVFSKQKAELAATPSIMPTRGRINSGFGMRISPFTGRWERHEGVDIANDVGTPVVSTAEGVVRFVGRNGGYGITIIIAHGYGYSTLYAHLSRVLVQSGQHVKRHQVIALMGNSGLSTGPHLHYEVRVNGKPVNPRYYILN